MIVLLIECGSTPNQPRRHTADSPFVAVLTMDLWYPPTASMGMCLTKKSSQLFEFKIMQAESHTISLAKKKFHVLDIELQIM